MIAHVYEECLQQTPTRFQRKVEKKEDKEKKKHKKDARDEGKDNADDHTGETPLQKKIRAVVEDLKKGRFENRCFFPASEHIHENKWQRQEGRS